MTLTRDSVFFYHSSRYGINPRIGGRPVFTRNSAGSFATQEGEIDQAIVNTPRLDWETVSGERRKVLTLEMASTNIVPDDFASWTDGSCTVTGGQPDPAGGTGASLLTSTVDTGSRARTLTFTGNGNKGMSLRVRAGTAPASTIGIFDATATVWRGEILVTWTAGVPSLSVASGSATLYPVRALGGGYYELKWVAIGVVAANTNAFYVRPHASLTGSISAYKPQAENEVIPTSMINGFSTARAVDSLHWYFLPNPQAMMVYVRFVELGSVLKTSSRVMAITAIPEANPEFLLYHGTGVYNVYHQNGTSAVVLGIPVAPAMGDTNEIIGLLTSDGRVRAIQSINGAAVVDTGVSAALTPAAAWSGPKLWLNSSGEGAPGVNRFAELKIVKYADVVATTAQGIMDELRAFELGPNSEVL